MSKVYVSIDGFLIYLDKHRRMKRSMISILLLLGLGWSASAQMKTKTDRKMFFVLLKIEKPSDIAYCYTLDHDVKSVGIEYAYEDTMDVLREFVFEEDALEGPDCFVPDIKMIFEKHTYIMSLYCSKVLKYHNSLPYTPSNKRVENDLALTENLVEYLGRLKRKHFNMGTYDFPVKNTVINASEPIVEKKLDDSVLDLLLNEDWEEDLEEEDLKTAEERILPDEEEVEEEEGEGNGENGNGNGNR